MSAVVTGTYQNTIQFNQVLTGFATGQNFPIAFPNNNTLRGVLRSSGVLADQANLLHARTYVFAASTPQTIDLTALPDVFGAAGACNFARVRLLAIRMNGIVDGSSLVMGGAGANEWGGFLSTGGTLKVFPGTTNNDGFLILAAPNTTGIVVTPTSKLLLLTPSAHAFTTDLIIAGCDA
jgi:hypothetical protein